MKKIIMKELAIFIIVSIMLIGCNNKNIEMTKDSQKYLSAVEEMVDYYEENPYIFYNCNEGEWKKSLKELKEDIKANKVNDNDIFYRLQELSAGLNNEHTYCEKDNDDEFLPIKGRYFNNGFYIVVADKRYKKILGKELIAINGVGFADVEKKYSKIISAKNDQWVKSKISTDGFSKSSLKYLRLWKDNNILTFRDSKGKTEEVNIDVVSQEEMNKIIMDSNSYFAYKANNKQINNSEPDGGYPQYWYKLDKDNKILYFQYNVCLDKNDLNKSVMFEECSNYPDFKEFQELFTKFANKNNDNYDKIVVDVSNNTGGNMEHLENLINCNLNLFNSKKVYAIITKNTFSAGVVAVETLADKCNATIVGEETGGTVEIFAVQEKKSSILPITYFSGCTKINVLNKASRNTNNNSQGIIPDIYVEYTIEDSKNGINPYYQTIINN